MCVICHRNFTRLKTRFSTRSVFYQAALCKLFISLIHHIQTKSDNVFPHQNLHSKQETANWLSVSLCVFGLRFCTKQSQSNSRSNKNHSIEFAAIGFDKCNFNRYDHAFKWQSKNSKSINESEFQKSRRLKFAWQHLLNVVNRKMYTVTFHKSLHFTSFQFNSIRLRACYMYFTRDSVHLIVTIIIIKLCVNNSIYCTLYTSSMLFIHLS